MSRRRRLAGRAIRGGPRGARRGGRPPRRRPSACSRATPSRRCAPSPTRRRRRSTSTAASIALHDPVANRLVFRAAAGPQGEGVLGLSVAPNEGIAGYAFATGQPLAIADVTDGPALRARDRRADRVRAAIAAGRPARRRRRDHRGDGVARPARWRAVRPGRSRGRDPRRRPPPRPPPGRPGSTARPAGCSGGPSRSCADARLGTAPTAVLAARGRGGRSRPSSPRSPRSSQATIRCGGWPTGSAQLRAADPDDVELAIDWLDALLARTRRRSRPGRRSRAADRATRAGTHAPGLERRLRRCRADATHAGAAVRDARSPRGVRRQPGRGRHRGDHRFRRRRRPSGDRRPAGPQPPGRAGR